MSTIKNYYASVLLALDLHAVYNELLDQQQKLTHKITYAEKMGYTGSFGSVLEDLELELNNLRVGLYHLNFLSIDINPDFDRFLDPMVENFTLDGIDIPCTIAKAVRVMSFNYQLIINKLKSARHFLNIKPANELTIIINDLTRCQNASATLPFFTELKNEYSFDFEKSLNKCDSYAISLIEIYKPTSNHDDFFRDIRNIVLELNKVQNFQYLIYHLVAKALPSNLVRLFNENWDINHAQITTTKLANFMKDYSF